MLQKSIQACIYITDNYGAVIEDYIGKVTMNSLKDDLLKVNYYLFCYRSTDKSVTEQEVIYILFLQDGAPISELENANTARVLSSINTAFKI